MIKHVDKGKEVPGIKLHYPKTACYCLFLGSGYLTETYSSASSVHPPLMLQPQVFAYHLLLNFRWFLMILKILASREVGHFPQFQFLTLQSGSFYFFNSSLSLSFKFFCLFILLIICFYLACPAPSVYQLSLLTLTPLALLVLFFSQHNNHNPLNIHQPDSYIVRSPLWQFG